MIKFVSDLQQVGGFLCVLWFPSQNKTDRNDIPVAEILLKVMLNTTKKIMEPQCQKLEARLKYFKNEKKEILLKC